MEQHEDEPHAEPALEATPDAPVTPEDVKFTFENYRGALAGLLKAKLDRIDLPDDRTVKFFFKEPFLDFLLIYGSPASGVVSLRYSSASAPGRSLRSTCSA